MDSFFPKDSMESHAKTIYVELNSCLVKLEGVKIIWSKIRQCYELIEGDTQIIVSENQSKTKF